MTREAFVAMVAAKMSEAFDMNNAPFGADGTEAIHWNGGKESALQWVLEMLPDRFE